MYGAGLMGYGNIWIIHISISLEMVWQDRTDSNAFPERYDTAVKVAKKSLSTIAANSLKTYSCLY